jgi:hypothetical protein
MRHFAHALQNQFAALAVMICASTLSGTAFAQATPSASNPAQTKSTATESKRSCVWEWICDGMGGCKQTPICERLTDDPGTPPGGEPPKPPHSLPPSELPRAQSGLKCAHVQRFNPRNMRWVWDQACYCTSRTGAETKQGAGTPLSGIGKCESPPSTVGKITPTENIR